MSEEHITIAERIRRIVKASAAALSTREIYAADDNFENLAQVAGQMSQFLARGEFIGTKGDGGRLYYSAVEGHVQKAQGTRGPAKAGEKAVDLTSPAAQSKAAKLPRAVRNSVLLAKVETTYGKDRTPGETDTSLVISSAPILLREGPPPELPVDNDEGESGDDIEFFINDGGWLSIQVGDDSVMIDPKHIGRLNKFTDATAALWGGV